MAKTYGSTPRPTPTETRDSAPKVQRVEVVRDLRKERERDEAKMAFNGTGVYDEDHVDLDDDEIVDKISARASKRSRTIVVICGVILMIVALAFGFVILRRSGILGRVHQSAPVAETSSVDEPESEAVASAMRERLKQLEAEENEVASRETEAADKDEEGHVVVPEGFTEHVEGYAINEAVADTSGDTLKVKGQLINLTDGDRGPCAVGYQLYDKDNVAIGFASIACDTVKAGDVWNFTADSDVPTGQVHRFELVEVRF